MDKFYILIERNENIVTPLPSPIPSGPPPPEGEAQVGERPYFLLVFS